MPSGRCRERRGTLLDGIDGRIRRRPGPRVRRRRGRAPRRRVRRPRRARRGGGDGGGVHRPALDAPSSSTSPATASFRRDNPMFSSLHVADGPLNVYDLEGLERLPVVVVLSSCSVANAKVVQGGSLLGLANAFTTLGAASVIAPLTPISDAASVTVMDRLHRQLIAGADPAAALAAATMSHDVADPTAAAFIALGPGHPSHRRRDSDDDLRPPGYEYLRGHRHSDRRDSGFRHPRSPCSRLRRGGVRNAACWRASSRARSGLERARRTLRRPRVVGRPLVPSLRGDDGRRRADGVAAPRRVQQLASVSPSGSPRGWRRRPATRRYAPSGANSGSSRTPVSPNRASRRAVRSRTSSPTTSPYAPCCRRSPLCRQPTNNCCACSAPCRPSTTRRSPRSSGGRSAASVRAGPGASTSSAGCCPRASTRKQVDGDDAGSSIDRTRRRCLAGTVGRRHPWRRPGARATCSPPPAGRGHGGRSIRSWPTLVFDSATELTGVRDRGGARQLTFQAPGLRSR